MLPAAKLRSASAGSDAVLKVTRGDQAEKTLEIVLPKLPHEII